MLMLTAGTRLRATYLSRAQDVSICPKVQEITTKFNCTRCHFSWVKRRRHKSDLFKGFFALGLDISRHSSTLETPLHLEVESQKNVVLR